MKDVMKDINIPTKFRFNQEVVIRKGFYRGFKAKIIDFKIADDPDAEINPNIIYDIKIDGVAGKEKCEVYENNLYAYKKYFLF